MYVHVLHYINIPIVFMNNEEIEYTAEWLDQVDFLDNGNDVEAVTACDAFKNTNETSDTEATVLNVILIDFIIKK